LNTIGSTELSKVKQHFWYADSFITSQLQIRTKNG